MYKSIPTIIIVFCMMLGIGVARADEFSSTDYTVLDPVIAPAGYGSSAGFQLWSTLSELAIGTSTITSYGVNSGFLYFPTVSAPVVSATAGDGEVDLTWTSSEGFQGWTASSYTVGQSTTSGGPYTYTSLGNVFLTTRSSLTNGTPYYFVIRVNDIFGNPIGTSTQVTATPVAGAGPTPGPGGSTGGGGGPPSFVDQFLGAGAFCSVSGADLNGDGKVNLIDLSILLYYLGKSFPQHDCNEDGIIDFIDISIMFYHWTG